MFELLSKGKLNNQPLVDIIRLLTRMADMWLVLVIYDFLYMELESKIEALMGVAFCLIVNYLVILFPTEIYLKIPRRSMMFALNSLRMIVLLGLIWQSHYGMSFVSIIVLGLLICGLAALHNGLIILYRKPFKETEVFPWMGRRIIYLIVPLFWAYGLFELVNEIFNFRHVLYFSFVTLLMTLPMIPFIKYRKIIVFEEKSLEFTIDGLIMCAIEYLVKLLAVVAVAFQMSVLYASMIFFVTLTLIIGIAWLKSGVIREHRKKGANHAKN